MKFLFQVLILCFFISCNGGGDSAPSGPTGGNSPINADGKITDVGQATQALVGKSFSIYSVNGATDIDTCLKDTIATFFANGRYETKVNTKCEEDEEDTDGTWSIQEYPDGVYLIFDDQDDPGMRAQVISYLNGVARLGYDLFDGPVDAPKHELVIEWKLVSP